MFTFHDCLSFPLLPLNSMRKGRRKKPPSLTRIKVFLHSECDGSDWYGDLVSSRSYLDAIQWWESIINTTCRLSVCSGMQLVRFSLTPVRKTEAAQTADLVEPLWTWRWTHWQLLLALNGNTTAVSGNGNVCGICLNKFLYLVPPLGQDKI